MLSTMQKTDVLNKAMLDNGKLWLSIDERDLLTTKRVSSIPGTRYHVLKELYEMPLTYKNVESLATWHFIFGKSLRDWERVTRQDNEIRRMKLKKIPGFVGTLYPYQTRGVEWIDECDGRALIADEMGLGKTIQALAWCQLHQEIRPVLVICPSMLKINWEREIQKWVNNATVQVLDGRTPAELKRTDFVVINYDILHWWANTLISYGFHALIADEAHYIKSNNAKRTKAFKRVSKYITNIVALTGTPIENSPIEIFNIVNVINPAIFPDYVRFTKQYCEGKNDRYGWNTSGSSNTQELYRILTATIMIRRKKSEVLKDLPPKQISVVPLQITNKQEYKQAEKQFMDFLSANFDKQLVENENIEKELRDYAKKHEVELSEEFTSDDVQVVKELKMEKAKNAHVLVQMSMLKQLAVKGKMDAVFEWVDDFLETGEKLVLFGINKVIIRELAKRYPTAARVDGSVTQSKRQKDIDRFQRDPNCKLFIGNIDAAGVGLTLTSASNVALVQYPWTPSKMSQAIDRVHRITQTKRVNVWNLIAAGTIEDKIIKVLSEKEKIITDILDGGVHDEASVASAILKMYKVR